MDRNTGKSRGFAFVTFATVAGANAALVEEAKNIDVSVCVFFSRFSWFSAPMYGDI